MKKNTIESVLNEFISNVDAVGMESLMNEIDWPDMAVTYIAALKMVGRLDDAHDADKIFHEHVYGED